MVVWLIVGWESWVTARGVGSRFIGPLRVRDRDQDGQLLTEEASLVAELGFRVGQPVIRKQDKVTATIVALKGDKVTLDICDGPISGTATVSAESFRKGQWKILKSVPEAKLEVTDVPAHSALNSQEMTMAHTRGKIIDKLLQLEKQHKTVLTGVKVQLKPVRDVIAVQKFSIGALCLVPCTFKVESKEKAPPQSIPIGMIRGIKFQLASCFVGPDKDGSLDHSFIQPFWLIRSTHHQEKANMELVGSLNEDYDNSGLAVPLFKNIKVIADGDVLLRYAPKEEKKEDLDDLVPVKRRKTGKGAESAA